MRLNLQKRLLEFSHICHSINLLLRIYKILLQQGASIELSHLYCNVRIDQMCLRETFT